MLLRSIKIGISADTSRFSGSIRGAIGDLDKLAESSRTAQSAMGDLDTSKGRGGSTGGGGASSSSSGDNGAGMALLASSLAPLAGIGTQIGAQINALGGTLTTLARRVDAAIRFPAMKRALDEVQAALRSKVAQAGTVAEASLTRVQRATLALGPAALAAIGGYRAFNNIATIFNTLTNRGDVARKSLSQLGQTKFDASVGGAKGLTGALATVSPTAARAATSIKGLGLQLGLAFGLVGVVYKLSSAIKNFFVGGIKGASDLNETMAKTGEVFGDQTSLVTTEADKLAKSYGFLKGPLLDAASSFGLIFNGAKVADEVSAEYSATLLKLAADATSFYNVPMDQALEKIRAGLIGEAEPLRAFGVLLNEDAVKAEAMALGLNKGKRGIDDAAKVAARFSLIQKGLATSSGDLERTQGAVANQFRKAGGGLGNFATSVGTILLPAVNMATVTFNELLSTMVETFESNRGMIEGWAGYLTGAIDKVGYGIRNFGALWQVAQISATQAMVNFMEYVDVIPANFRMITDYLGKNWFRLIMDIIKSTKAMSDNIDKNFGGLFTSIKGFLNGEGWNFQWTPLLDGFQATAEKFPELLKPVLTDMSGEMVDIFADIDRKEAARKKALAPIAGKKAEAGADADKPEKYKGTAVAKLGSKEANEVLARFRNQSGGDEPAKATAKNTATIADLLTKVSNAMDTANRKQSANPVTQAIANL